MIFCGWVDREEKPMGLKEFVKGAQDDPGLNSDPFLLRVGLKDLVHIFVEIQEDALPDFIAGTARPSSSGSDRNSPLGGILNCLDDIRFMPGLHNPQRFDPV